MSKGELMAAAERHIVMPVIGTRPEAIKLWPVVRALQACDDIEVRVCLTAQHREMLDMFVRELGIPVHVDLDLMRPDQSLADLSARLIPAIAELLEREHPHLVLVQGDTTSAALCALAAFYECIPVGHVEAGLRSGNRRRPFPEEINRRLIGQLADLHFAPTRSAADNLLAEGIAPEAVFVTGNPVIDTVRRIAGEVQQSPTPRVLMTVHRRENFGEPLQQILAGVRAGATAHPELAIVYPVHPNPNVHGPAHAVLGGLSNIHLCEPMGYREFVAEMQRAWFILSDSGGVQEEATALGRPVLLLRRETERPEGRDAGNVRLVALDKASVVAAVDQLLKDEPLRRRMSVVSEVFGNGDAGEKIAALCRDFLARQMNA